MRISVCIATYNGARYLIPQITSILTQLNNEDEVVIVDDASTDGTVKVIRGFEDPRIRLYVHPGNQGAVRTFGEALALAQGELVLLSDQDDLWLESKVSTVRDLFDSQDVDLVVHDAVVMGEEGVLSDSLFRLRNSGPGVIKNLLSNTYVGCCMALRSSLLPRLLPIPALPGVWHDGWMGILATYYGSKVVFLDTPLIQFRRHGNTTSALKRRGSFVVLRDRLVLLTALTRHILLGRLKPQ